MRTEIAIFLALLSSDIILADGIDKKDELVTKDGKPTVYHEFDIYGKPVYLEDFDPRPYNPYETPFYWYPSKSMPVKPTGPNYWIYFDQNNCRGEYARVFHGMDDNPCINRNKSDNEQKSKAIPEPNPLILLLLGLVLFICNKVTSK